MIQDGSFAYMNQYGRMHSVWILIIPGVDGSLFPEKFTVNDYK